MKYLYLIIMTGLFFCMVSQEALSMEQEKGLNQARLSGAVVRTVPPDRAPARCQVRTVPPDRSPGEDIHDRRKKAHLGSKEVPSVGRRSTGMLGKTVGEFLNAGDDPAGERSSQGGVLEWRVAFYYESSGFMHGPFVEVITSDGGAFAVPLDPQREMLPQEEQAENYLIPCVAVEREAYLSRDYLVPQRDYVLPEGGKRYVGREKTHGYDLARFGTDTYSEPAHFAEVNSVLERRPDKTILVNGGWRDVYYVGRDF